MRPNQSLNWTARRRRWRAFRSPRLILVSLGVMQLGNPISSLWFFLFIAVALIISCVIYQCAGNVPYRP
jgi:hypothetical protein